MNRTKTGLSRSRAGERVVTSADADQVGKSEVFFFDCESGMLHLTKASVSVHIVKRGIGYTYVNRLAEHLGVGDNSILMKIGVAGGTIARRRRADVLKPDESDKLYRLAKITAMTERVLEDPVKAKDWLQTKNRALGGVSPFSLLDTEPGIEMVEDALNQIEYGVYS
jgi:putative toxin-antitoxin system antitoxin component (TIGR02293 family)